MNWIITNWLGIGQTLIALLLLVVILAQPTSKTGGDTFATPILQNVLGRRSTSYFLTVATMTITALFFVGCLWINHLENSKQKELTSLSEELSNLGLEKEVD